ncbi:enoyl-CoA hydratase [Actinophytocola xinjiangensis]|uniref:Enoyl-CoA hydratase n=1 Tax=Actinophytocola xinjiangensis TaxID=485602 RepID=A0A7Z0WN52_9PSEU|nr:enoyl-CoA hydratase-related protein [Actinophytocola xinjiangensis]OLF11467.1 enoyl-CoA hydratase [Actinophytocola xinjiangensis]
METIAYETADGIATITLDRPDARNGYTVRMSDELVEAFTRADDDPAVRVVVLTGRGKDFCVGADLSGGGLDLEGAGEDWVEPASRCSLRIYTMNKPVIAALRGAAVGAGSTIVLPADYRLAATDSRFGFVFVRRGLYPEGASTWFLPRLVGMGRAMDWMVSGRVFDSTEALAAGLVHSVHAPEDVAAAAYELARSLIADCAPVSMAVVRQQLYRMSGMDSPFPAGRLDSRLIADAVSRGDTAEGVLSFLEKRKPVWGQKVPADLPPFLPWA